MTVLKRPAILHQKLAKLKYDFLHSYYSQRIHRWRDYLFAYIAFFTKVGSLAPCLTNTALNSRAGKWVFSRFFGLSEHRSFPRLALSPASKAPAQPTSRLRPDVLVLSDAFSRYFHPETERASLQVLYSIGLIPRVLSGLGAGRTLICKGFLEAARRRASQLFREIEKYRSRRCSSSNRH